MNSNTIQTLFLNEHNRIVEGLRPHAEAVKMPEADREELLYQVNSLLIFLLVKNI